MVFHGFSRSGTPQIVALGGLVLILDILGASFLEVDFQEDFDEDPERREPGQLRVMSGS